MSEIDALSPGSRQDPAFSSAVEAAYLASLAGIRPTAEQTVEGLHAELLDQAVYKADRTNGGVRFKTLDNASELDQRLLRALSNHLGK